MNDPTSFSFMQAKDYVNFGILIATIVAIVVGPIFALYLADRKEARKRKTEREYAIFYKLMKTRRIILHHERVEALNLIQLEFCDDEKIITAYKNYIQHLTLSPQNDAEAPSFFEEREDRFVELVHEIGLKLGFKFDKRDLNKFAYAPQGWAQEQNEQQVARKLLIEILSGSRPLYTSTHSPNPNYPPIPT